MPVQKLKKLLDDNGVKYVSITHSPAFTAHEIAASAHISEKEMAKTVILKAGDRLVIVVLPASQRVDIERMREVTGAAAATLADETEFQKMFPGCEVGAMPPFGNLYGMDVFVSQQLRQSEQIAFNAGSHTELIRLPYGDFAKLVNPVLVEF